MDDPLRASDADRDHAAEQLRAHYVAGRLTRDELDERLATALDAVTLGTLSQSLSDLPQPAPVRPEAVRLERRYRRLLDLYPARYRRVHGEEMLAVLMTAAPETQDRPGLAETADLITGAVRVRCQAARGHLLGWRAATSLTGAGAVLGLLAGIPFATVTRPPASASVTIPLGQLNGELIQRAHIPDPQNAKAAGVLPPTALDPAFARSAKALATSYPVLARAARTMRPATSERALQQRVTVSVATGELLAPASAGLRVVQGEAQLDISVQASSVRAAENRATAVADSYIRAGGRDVLSHASGGRIPVRESGLPVPQVMSPPGPVTSDAGQTSAAGALAGGFLGAITAAALTFRRRRYQAT